MKEYQSTPEWVILAADNGDKESTLYRVINVEDEGTVLVATDRSRLHFAERSEPYPFSEGAWSLVTGAHTEAAFPGYRETMHRIGAGFELFAADARACILAAAAAAKAKTLPTIVYLPTSGDEGAVALKATQVADAVSGAYHGQGLYYPITYWAPGPKAGVVFEIDSSNGPVDEKRVAVVMPLHQETIEGPRISVDLAGYVNARQPVLL